LVTGGGAVAGGSGGGKGGGLLLPDRILTTVPEKSTIQPRALSAVASAAISP
jgi:hypothetical protein